MTDADAPRNAAFPLIFAAPSGAGKTSIAQALRAWERKQSGAKLVPVPARAGMSGLKP